MEQVLTYIGIAVVFVFVNTGINSCNEKMDLKKANIEKACIPKCGKHPVITQDRKGNCLCNNTVTIEK